MRSVLVALVIVGLGCSGSTPPEIDANPAGPRCTMQFYDLCNEEHDCPAPMICQNFATDGFQVCTTNCDASNPCPNDRSGSPAACESGLCKPSAANMCHLGP